MRRLELLPHAGQAVRLEGDPAVRRTVNALAWGMVLGWTARAIFEADARLRYARAQWRGLSTALSVPRP